jgi:hypothetical protein
MVVPVSYSAVENYKKTKKHYTYAKENNMTKVSYDIEHAIIRICEREIQSVRSVEPLK